MKKLVYIIPIVLGGLVSDAYSHNLRQANVTIDGMAYEVWINQESDEAGSYQVAPGATECHTGDIIIEYFDVKYGNSQYTFCIEQYLTDSSTEVYQTALNLKVGDFIYCEGFMYSYNGPQLHTTKIVVSQGDK